MRLSSAVIVGVGSAAALFLGWQAGTTRIADAPPRVPTPAPAPTGSHTGTAPPATPATPTPTPVEPVVAVHDGQVIDTKYGTVQVRVVITGDVITEVSALTLTDSSDTSVAISARAAPILREEVLAAQSAAVTNVSGATYTSEAYLTSVQSALDAAGFAG